MIFAKNLARGYHGGEVNEWAAMLRDDLCY